MKSVAITGGYLVPAEDSHIGHWQRQSDSLIHDNFLPKYCASLIPSGGVAVDGGAYNGDHTLLYSNTVGADGLVYAIEPGPVYELLAHNAHLFPLKNVVTVNMALGCARGVAGHVTAGENFGASRVGSGTGVTITALDDIVDVSRPVDFMKLDLEGWEFAALLGARRILAESRPYLVYECNPSALHSVGCSVDAIHTLLTVLNYRYKPVGQVSPAQWDEVAWPAEKSEPASL